MKKGTVLQKVTKGNILSLKQKFIKIDWIKAKRYFNLLGIILLQFLFCHGAFATIYYVSTSGNNTNNGTSLSTPWRNINYAVNFAGLTGGDIIYVRGGTYSERVIMNKSGAAGNFITVKNYNTEVPVINGNGQTFTTPAHEGLFEARGSYTVIDGLKVINSRSDLDATGILVAGPVSFVTIKNCITNNTSSSGIAVWGFSSSYTGATNIVIENNDISEAVCGGYQENLTIAGGVDNFVVRNNVVHDCTTAPNAVNIPLGIDAKTNVRNGKIYGNNIYNLSYASGIYVDGYDNTAYNIDIYKNIIHNVAWYGISIGAEQAGSDYNINVYNNLVYNNGGHGISINGSNISTPNNIHDVNIYNNTVYGNGGTNGGNGINILNSSAYNIVAKNNIISQNTWANSVVVYSSNKANIIVSNNICDGVQNSYIPGSEYVIGTASIAASPSFVNAGSGNFKLNAGSPAINSATNTLVPSTDFDGNTRPSGGAYDIGAYEFGASSGGGGGINMLINPGFESALTSGWTSDWGNSVRNTTIKNSGTASLQVGPAQGGRAQVLTSGFTIGATYTLSAYCMMSGTGGPAGTNIGVICKNSAGVRTATIGSTDITNTGSFVQKSVTFTVPANTTSMEINVWYPGGTPSVYVDDYVLVSGSGAVPVASVSLSPGGLLLTSGSTAQLTSTVAPSNATNQVVTYTSSNTAVATVNGSGLVTTLSAGAATITVTTQDGNKTSSCAVTAANNMLVNPGFENALTSGWTSDWGNSQRITSVKNTGTASLQVGPAQGGRAQVLTGGFTVGGTYTLSAYCMLSGTGGPAGINIGVVCKNSAGVRTATVASSDIVNTGSFLKKSVTFTVPANTTSMEVNVWHPGGTSSVYADDFTLISGSSSPAYRISQPSKVPAIKQLTDEIKIYPNPIYNNSVTISMPELIGNNVIHVYDLIGNLVLNQKLSNQTIQKIRFNKHIPAGSYLLQIISDKKVHEKLIIVK